jgi:hypothetical protein
MRQQITAGGYFDFLTKSELHETLTGTLDDKIRDRYRGIKPMRIPLVTGTAANSVLIIDSSIGPEQGYAWDIGMIGIAGLTTGVTPDIVDMYFNGNTMLPWWQFNGNNYAYTFSRGEMMMFPGETISLRSVGTFNSASQVILFGMIRAEVPAEKLGMTVTS